MAFNPLLNIDFYKVDHRRQYPEGTTEIYSNFTPRYVKKSHNTLKDFNDKVVFFGLEYFLQKFYSNWQMGFFNRNLEAVIDEYKEIVEEALAIENFDCSHIAALHQLRYLPLKIKALPEGSLVPIGVPVLTVVNTHPQFYWLTNYIETYLSVSLWKPITSATTAHEYKRLLTAYAEETGADKAFIQFQAHDFSYRGMSCNEDAELSGAAHLLSFKGTDCVPAIALLKRFYRDKSDVELIGASVPATEHSVMCCTGESGEFEAIKRLITEVYPDGPVSIVSDSYNLWRVITQYLPELFSIIMKRNGKIIIRPDSGYPVDIICGDIGADEGTPANKGVMQLLWDIFGGIVNEKGFKQLNSHIGLIYGDAIRLDRAQMILDIMKQKGFASSNIVFGVGSYTYQYVTRDNFGFALKATSAVINGKRIAIFKDPITGDGEKKSAKGLLKVDFDLNKNGYYLIEDVSEKEENQGSLTTVFENGKLIKSNTLSQIRELMMIAET